MTLPALMNSIETSRFSSYLGLANNPTMFQEVLQGQPVVQRLLTELKDSGSTRKLLARVEALVREQDDVRYRNQRDAALAVYIWALDRTDHSLGKLAASIVLDIPRLWWARKIALQILGGSYTEPKVGQGTISLFTNEWSATSPSEGNESLIVMSPPSELVRSESVLDPSALKSGSEKNTDTVNASTALFSTSNSSPTTVQKS